MQHHFCGARSLTTQKKIINFDDFVYQDRENYSLRNDQEILRWLYFIY